ncbi:MAG: glycosyltransferase family 2 protein [Janthinobacterium lividum]
MPPALFDDVTLLITHYNRSGSVQRLLETLLAQQLRFAAIVVADDGSLPAHRQRLEHLAPVYGLQLVASARNYGLGHNLNQGQAHVQTALTLYVQEDFLPTPKFGPALQQAVALMRRDAQWDLVRFFANFRYPYTTPYQGEFAAITIPPFALDYHKIYAYSDNPGPLCARQHGRGAQHHAARGLEAAAQPAAHAGQNALSPSQVQLRSAL